MEDRDETYLDERIDWHKTDDAEYPYAANYKGKRLTLRINDFPAMPLYTLLVDGHPLVDFDNWPANWVRPH